MPRRPAFFFVVSAALGLALACQQQAPVAPTRPGGVGPAGGATTGGSPAAGAAAPTSAENVLAAERAGKIDHDTSLLFQVYAHHAPDRLPPELVGRPPGGFANTSLLREIALRRGAMRPDLQQAAEKLFRRPTDPESLWAQTATRATMGEPRDRPQHDRLAKDPGPPPAKLVPASAWAHVDSGDHIRIWYQPDMQTPDHVAMAEKATYAAQSLASRDAWGKERGAMGRAPCSDATVPGVSSDGQHMNGADGDGDPGAGRLDVYLIVNGQYVVRNDSRKDTVFGADTGGTLAQYPIDACGGFASFSMVDATTSEKRLPAIIAHEMFHDFQNAFLRDLSHDSKWLSEATAAWAEDLTYPELDTEWDYLNPPPGADAAHSVSDWQGKQPPEPDGPLTDYSPEVRGYAAYLFPFFLTQVVGMPTTVMESIWTSVATLPGTTTGDRGLTALTSVLKGEGPFRTSFKQFALVNWNADVDDAKKYTDVDVSSGAMGPLARVFQNAIGPTHVAKPGPEDATFDIPVSLGATQVGYYAIDVAAMPYVPQLSFDLSGVARNADVSVQAIVRVAAETGTAARYVDWTGAEEEHLCRDKAAEKVVSMVLIVANAAIDPSKAVSTTIHARAASACAPLEGNFTYRGEVHIQHGGNAACVHQADLPPVLKNDAGGSIAYTETVASQWSLEPTVDVTNPMTGERTIDYDINASNQITVDGGGDFTDEREISAPGGSSKQTAHVSFHNHASGQSCNGAPKNCTPAWTPPLGQPHDGRAGHLRLHVARGGATTYDIIFDPESVPMQSSCTQTWSDTGKDAVHTQRGASSTTTWDPSSSSMITHKDGQTFGSTQRTPPAGYSTGAMSNAPTFWKGTLPPNGDIDVSGSCSDRSCGVIGLISVPCTYDGFDGCDTGTVSGTAHLHIHVDVPQAPVQSPSQPPPPNADPCTQLTACCQSLASLPQATSFLAGCTILANQKNTAACAQMLATLKAKNLCHYSGSQ